MGAAAISPWLRWCLPLLLVALAWQAPASPEPPAIFTSSGSHAWWVRTDGRRFFLEHVALQADGSRSGVHQAATFEDRPVALAASEDRVWVAFESSAGRCEVIGGRAIRNPASGLWFTSPPGLRLSPGLVTGRSPALAAVGDRVLAITAEGLRELAGGRWIDRPLPEGVPASACRLVAAQDGLWLLRAADGGVWERWALAEGSGVNWQPRPLQNTQLVQPVDGALRLAFAGGRPPRLGLVEMGSPRMDVSMPEQAAVGGWGTGFAAVRVQTGQVWWAEANATAAAFGDFELLQPQASVADRWFHLPVLGVLSLGCIMLAFLVRLVRRAFGRVEVESVFDLAAPILSRRFLSPAEPVFLLRHVMPLGSRLAALAMDALPCAIASWLAFDAEWSQMVTPPLWSFNLAESLPFIWMTVGTILFGFIEESVGGRSIGKRAFGGEVVARPGGRAGVFRHLVRNLLKGLAMLSPVVALPAMIDRRGEGVAETLSGTLVVTTEIPPPRT
ncbi:MAG: hypothetical protein EBQ99_06935 [Planctomycetes bacterium]|nr:hypothetical protein [Planctomycetota bacterium]